MSLDVKTLFLLTIYVEAVLGILLLFVWTQNLGIKAIAWWGSAHLLRAASAVLFGLYGEVSNLISIDLASAVLFASYAVTWNGARVFDSRSVLPGSLIAGAAVWLAAGQLPGLLGTPDIRHLVSSAIVATYAWATAYEFWRGRAERLVSRWPAIFILFAHGALFLLHTPRGGMSPWSAELPVMSSAWLTVLSAESLLFPISVAFILLAMTKERSELRHKTAAMVDPLTGLANRRAFMQDALGLTQRQISLSRPIAVFMIDLDHFKSINDRFGHAVGDRALQVFAATVRPSLRATDLVGRLGGEEFAVVLADAGGENAFHVAERVRLAYATAAVTIDDHPVGGTTSIGVAVIQDPNDTIDILLAEADQALYRAKALGRNRVEVAPLRVEADDSAHSAAAPSPGVHPATRTAA